MSKRQRDIPLHHPPTAALLAWLIPGLGHIYQGRIGKGVLFFVTLMGTLVWGMYLGEWKVVYWSWDPERKPVIEGICRLGMGLPVLPSYLQSFTKEGELPLVGRFQAAPSMGELHELNARLNAVWDIAKIFTMIACLLNVLVIYDAYAGPAEPPRAPQESEPQGAAA